MEVDSQIEFNQRSSPRNLGENEEYCGKNHKLIHQNIWEERKDCNEEETARSVGALFAPRLFQPPTDAKAVKKSPW